MVDSFPKYFNPQELGSSLKEVAVDVIRANDQEVVSRWFHSSKDADLFIWSDSQKNILKQQLSYYGQVVEWNVVEGVRTGHIIEEQKHGDSFKSSGSEFLHFDIKPHATIVEQAVRLLECITALSGDERKVLQHNFMRVGSSQNISPEEFVARFGAYLKDPRKASLPWWKRLWNELSLWLKA